MSKNLQDFCLNFLNKKAKYAGLLVVYDNNIVCIKRAMLLKPKTCNFHYYNDSEENLRFLGNLIAKMGSELASLRNKKEQEWK